jgi:hypothetical protein
MLLMDSPAAVHGRGLFHVPGGFLNLIQFSAQNYCYPEKRIVPYATSSDRKTGGRFHAPMNWRNVMNNSRSRQIRYSSLLSFFFLPCIFLPVVGCHRDVAGVGPGEVRATGVRWVDVDAGGSTSGIQVQSTALLPTTSIMFELPYDGYVTLSICDGLDNPVARPIDNQHLPAGVFQVDFNAGGLASGIYLYTLVVRGVNAEGAASEVLYSKSRKMMLLK